MVYKAISPQATLRPFVKCIWTLEGTAGPHRERVLPDGCSEMIIHFGDQFRRHHLDGTVEIQPISSVVGQISQYIQLEGTGTIGMVGVRFYPQGLSSFTRLPMDELSNQSVPLSDIFGKDGECLTSRVIEARSNAERIRLIEVFLMQKLANPPDFVIGDCVTKILSERGQVRVDQLRKNFRVSKRHFERKFTAGVGLSPKLFGRLIRFHHATRLIAQGTFTNLAALSQESGYYDQAHFTRDFKEFSGLNPTAYFKAAHDMNDLFFEG